MRAFQEYYSLYQSLDYCAKNNMRIHDLYRVGSPSYFHLINGTRDLLLNEGLSLDVDDCDMWILTETDLGMFSEYEGTMVPLDMPMVQEESEDQKELNTPKRGGSKKYYVYTKNDKGNVVKVEFGDPNSTVNFSDKKARESFAARHRCSEKTDKTTPGYWSCNLPKYSDSLGLSGGGNFFW